MKKCLACNKPFPTAQQLDDPLYMKFFVDNHLQCKKICEKKINDLEQIKLQIIELHLQKLVEEFGFNAWFNALSI